MAVARILEPPEMSVYRLTVEQYRRIVEAGIVDEDDNVELLEGLLIQQVRKTPGHVYSVSTLFHRFHTLMPESWFVDSQQPFDTLDSEPEPDSCIIRGTIEDYMQRLPASADVGLVVEVADTTLERDRRTKLRIYARAGIPFYWIVNLIDRQVEVYSQPYTEDGVSGYHQRVDVGVDGAVTLVLDRREVAQINVAEMLP